MRLIALILIACAFPAVAHAQSFSVPAEMGDVNFPSPNAGRFGPEGPAIAGDSVVWWDRRGTRAHLMVASATSKPREIVSGSARRFPALHVAAFGNRAIAQRGNAFYEVDVAAGTARRFDPCLGSAACTSCRARTGFAGFQFELLGTVLATGHMLDCRNGAVHDFHDGGTRAFDGPVLAAAGRYALVVGPIGVALYDWRTGRRLRSVAEFGSRSDARRQVAVDEDGTVAVAGDVERTTRNPFGAGDQIRLARGLLAQRRVIQDEELDEELGANAHTVLWVSRPDGSQTRRISGQRYGGGWDFDGRRLAWATQPCMEIRIQVWDLADDPPRPASERCGVPRIRGRTVQLDRSQDDVILEATCPRRPARGCDGDMRAVLRRRGGGRRVTETFRHPVHLHAGETASVFLPVGDPRKLRSVAGALRGRFIFTSHGRRSAVTRDVTR